MPAALRPAERPLGAILPLAAVSRIIASRRLPGVTSGFVVEHDPQRGKTQLPVTVLLCNPDARPSASATRGSLCHNHDYFHDVWQWTGT